MSVLCTPGGKVRRPFRPVLAVGLWLAAGVMWALAALAGLAVRAARG
jgi:hypothetical protein